MDNREITAMELSARATVYRIMQAFFGREPQAPVVESLASEEFLQVASLFFDQEPAGAAPAAGAEGAGDGRSAEGAGSVSEAQGAEGMRDAGSAGDLGEESSLAACVAELQAAARRCAEGGDEALDALGDAYARLFVGPRRPEAAPWESAYVGEDDTLFQPSTLEVRKAYVAHGLIPSRYPRIADDHLALELGFLASLGQRASDAYEAGDADGLKVNVEASRRFLDEHVLSWLPEFCEELDQSSCGTLYCEAARALESFARADRRFLDALEVAAAFPTP